MAGILRQRLRLGCGAGFQAAGPKLVLASGSVTRQMLLASAGLVFEAVSPGIDEACVKTGARATGVSAGCAALTLARLKAQAVVRPDAVVIGCDQILVCGGDWFDKPVDSHGARAHLQALRGRTHVLHTAMVGLRDGAEIWSHMTAPSLTMRPFSDAFLDAYLQAEGTALLASVGAYRLEGLGAQLFDRIEGEHSAILGLPLLPLLGFLRRCEIVCT